MTKNTLTSLVNYLNGATVDNLDEIKAELEKELARGEEKAQVNRELYAQAHDVVMNGLARCGNVTVTDLYNEIENELPEGFSKGKVQYALTHYWESEVVKTEGKPNSYALRG